MEGGSFHLRNSAGLGLNKTWKQPWSQAWNKMYKTMMLNSQANEMDKG